MTKYNKILLNFQKYFLDLKNHPKMAYQGQQKIQKVMVQPINLIFRFLQSKARVSVWLYENVNTRMEGVITGFDEYMNLVTKVTVFLDLALGHKFKLFPANI